jgi:hypothetical protein
MAICLKETVFQNILYMGIFILTHTNEEMKNRRSKYIETCVSKRPGAKQELDLLLTYRSLKTLASVVEK